MARAAASRTLSRRRPSPCHSTGRGARRSPSSASAPGCSWRSRSPGSCGAGKRQFETTSFSAPWGSWSSAPSPGARGSAISRPSICSLPGSPSSPRQSRPLPFGRCGRPLRAKGHVLIAAALVILCVVQLGVGAATGMFRLQLFGPHTYQPIPDSILAAIRQLPPDAKLAYACRPLEEVGFGTPRLLSIDAHTGRRVVPMCFEAEVLSGMIGAKVSDKVENLFFANAPQRDFYPNVTAHPSSVETAAFLKSHGIDYIYSDAQAPEFVGGQRDACREERRGRDPQSSMRRMIGGRRSSSRSKSQPRTCRLAASAVSVVLLCAA